MIRTYFIASWDQGPEEGVTQIEYDKEKDILVSRKLLKRIKRSSYFARKDSYLYVLTEAPMSVPEGGCISTLRIDEEGVSIISSIDHFDSGVTHLMIDQEGKHLYASGYGTGTLFAIDTDQDGFLSNCRNVFSNSGFSLNKTRQNASHMHFTCETPDGEYLCTCDLGTDEIIIFNICKENGDVTKTGSLKTPLGYGPRHMVFSKDGKYAYVLCELTYHLLIYAYEGTGNLEFIDDIDLYPEAPADKRQCSAIKISEDGKLLFTANRGEGYNSLDAWDLKDPESPSRIASYRNLGYPRDFILLEDGYIALCNQAENNVQFIKFENGCFKETGKIEDILMPVSIIEW